MSEEGNLPMEWVRQDAWNARIDAVRNALVERGWKPPSKEPKRVRTYNHQAEPKHLPAHLTDTNMDCTCTRLAVFADRSDTDANLAADLHRLLASRHDWRLRALANDDRANRNYQTGRRDERRRQETERGREWQAAFFSAAREAELLPAAGDAVGQSHRQLEQCSEQGGEEWAGGALHRMTARAQAWLAATSPWDDAPYEGGFEQLRQDFRGLMILVAKEPAR